MRTATAIALTAAALAAAAPAAAQDARDQDLRCFIVMTGLVTKMTEPAMQNAVKMGAVYYLGKLKGRDPTADLKPLVTALLPRFDEPTIRAEAARCGAEMQAMGQETIALGEALRDAAEKAGAPPAPPARRP